MKDNLYYLNALMDGNSEGINAIYSNVFPKVKKFIYQNNGHLTDAEDIFQKALLQIAVRYKKEPFIIKSSFEAYLFTACKNLWRRELNKSKLKVTTDQIPEPKSDAIDHALSVLEQQRWELFTEGLERISENCKKVLTLYFEKVSYKEIMTRLNYNSETVVRQRVFKCKAKLTEIIKKDNRYNSLKEYE